MGGQASTSGSSLPSSGCTRERVCVCTQMGKRCALLCFLRMLTAERFALPSRVPRAPWTCTVGQRVSQQWPAARLCPPAWGSPHPTSPLLGHWPVRRLLRSHPASFSMLSHSLPATLLPLSCLSFLAICSWIPLRWASRGLPGQPRHSIAHPVPSQAPPPLPCPGYIRFFLDSENQLSTFLPSAACVLSSAVRPARGAAPLPTKKDSVHLNPRYHPELTPNSSVSSTTHTLV